MRISIVAVALAFIGGLALMSIKQDPSYEKPDMADLNVKRLVVPDSVSHWEVKNIVEKNLVSRLQGKGGIKAGWSYMDKSGHRNMVFENVDYEFRNLENYWIKLSDKHEVFGDLIRIDGSFRSHVCSFKIVYPNMEVYARRSVLDEWEDVVKFTGVKKAPKMRTSAFDELEEESDTLKVE